MSRTLKNLSLRTQVTTAFALVLAATIALGLLANNRIGALNSEAAEIRDSWLPGTRVLGRIAYMAMQYRQREATHILVDSDADRASEKKRQDSSRETLAKLRAEYEPLITAGEERRIADLFTKEWQAYAAA